jgi:tetratricopeptide (TPR) repeat protein
LPALRVFISHSHKDDTLASRLVEDLQAAGMEVWVDQIELTDGSFMQRIDAALARSEWCVLVQTPDALRSRAVRWEVDAAIILTWKDRMKGVIPFRVKPCDDNEVPVTWRTLHYYDATQDYATAVGDLVRAIRSDKRDPLPELLVMLLSEYQSFVKQERYQDALGVVDRMLAINERNADAWAKKAWLLNQLERHSEALGPADRALSIDPNIADAWNSSAWALCRLKRYDEALDAIERGLAITQDYAYMWTSKAAALDGLGRYEEALETYEHAISLADKWVWGWNGKANTLWHQQRYDEALTAFNEAIRFGPDTPWPASDKGAMLMELGRCEEALSAFDQALSIRPNIPYIQSQWAAARHCLGLDEEGHTELQSPQ